MPATRPTTTPKPTPQPSPTPTTRTDPSPMARTTTPTPLDIAVGAGTVTAEPWVLWESLIAATQRWTTHPADALRNNHGITVYDYRLLRLLARTPRPVRKSITHTALDLPPRSLDHSIARLTERGCLTVTGRGQEKRLRITDHGIEFLEAAITTLRTVTADSLPAAALPPRSRAALVTLLNRLRH
ncbi:putative transcriptional regulator [Actinoalloteichus hoggarensis]|uniref:Uncharacterized protein n=1 Tax=Actinoalloteichus hoggarensis TaxID=1470176 RepID=A0A221W869_9PSEU|nr:hypothetical protein [Actinoalloteichus hoggarensis]ASO21954.1 hypothetical protein AHOG_21690 [Actinoalloteichus hoggarensis]MBB5924498.1 putative transcriptional regulator [Actinoalloteichus hoggarensis]